MEGADFSGYATKAGLKCSDGRTITAEAFKHMDGLTVPLVWQHMHDGPENVLGHAILEARDDGMYAYGFFNDTDKGNISNKLVKHKDITSLSIYANGLIEKAKTVLHGTIKEVSLVIGGANKGAKIDQIRIAHSDDPDDIEVLDDEAIVFTGLDLEIAHSDEGLDSKEKLIVETPEEETPAEDEVVAHDDTKSLQEVLDTMSTEQKDVLEYLVGSAFEDGAQSVEHSDTDKTTDKTETDKTTEGDLSHQEGSDTMRRNVFEQQEDTSKTLKHSMTIDDVKGIMTNAEKKGSLKAAIEEYALAHSITDLDVLFPDAKLGTNGVEIIQRRTEWVAGVLDGVRKSPFSRVKSILADITADEARAKGYVKGNLKKEEIVRLLKRVTTPTTIYKKQKLDRDDVVDIVDLDIVAWIKVEMRMMLEEELARAILIGDGREVDDEDKIDEDCIRPIAWDNEMYAHPTTVPSNVTTNSLVETIIRARKDYKGTGTPKLYTTEDVLTDMLLDKDKLNNRKYKTVQELAATLRVSDIVTVEVMEDTPDLLAIMVNLVDYTIGADKGGEINMFDDFDIDYNQLKWLIETRASGALTKPKSAVVIKRTSGTTVVPTAPTFDPETNVLTIPSITGVTYYDTTDLDDGVVITSGAHTITRTTDIEARANSSYSFAHGTDDDWVFVYTP